jgi:PPOX class probable F420-dependent enzyme
MSLASLPPELARFLSSPRRAVMATVRRDGGPATTACWYDLVDGRVVFAMFADATRLRNIRRDPRVALTVLADDWYAHVSVMGRAVEIRDDPELVTLDQLSMRYIGEPYPDRQPGVSVTVEIERWHTYGSPD